MRSMRGRSCRSTAGFVRRVPVTFLGFYILSLKTFFSKLLEASNEGGSEGEV